MSVTTGMLPWARDGVRYTEKVTKSSDQSGRVWRQTWRQIGWVGQTGTPYPLGDLAVVHADEPGGYAPLWLLAHADEAVPDDDDTGRAASTVTTRADEERAILSELDALDAGQRHLWCRFCHPEWRSRTLGAELGAPFTAYCGVRAVILAPSAEDLPADSCEACKLAPRCPECGAP